jgi:putative Mg2+ transporter-C (MgtC) family protein
METKEFSIRILIAMACGLAIGFERQFRQKDAGLRTNALVALGAAIFTLLSVELTEKSGDITRIIGQVVSGIGFIGAGVIFKAGRNVHGLSSAATIWCSAAIGCLAAAGFAWNAFICTGLILFINIVLLPVDKWLRNRENDHNSTGEYPKEM